MLRDVPEFSSRLPRQKRLISAFPSRVHLAVDVLMNYKIEPEKLEKALKNGFIGGHPKDLVDEMFDNNRHAASRPVIVSTALLHSYLFARLESSAERTQLIKTGDTVTVSPRRELLGYLDARCKVNGNVTWQLYTVTRMPTEFQPVVQGNSVKNRGHHLNTKWCTRHLCFTDNIGDNCYQI